MELEQEQERRQLWLEQRRHGLGGSDVAAVLGISPFAGPFDVWLEKHGQVPPRATNEAMWWGTAMEDLIARRYTKTTGFETFKPEQPLLVHPRYPFLVASPDRIVKGRAQGLEIKTASVFSAHEWGEPGTDDIPVYYLTQVMHYLEVTRYERWDVAVLIGGNDFRVYTVLRNDEVQRAMVTKLTEWWQTHIIERQCPEINESPMVDAWVQRRFPRQTGERLKATQDMNVVAGQLRVAMEQRQAWDKMETTAKNKLKVMLESASGIDGPDYRVTWNKTADREEVDWRGAFNALVDALRHLDTPPSSVLADGIHSDIVSKHTFRVEGRRRFVFTPKKEGAK